MTCRKCRSPFRFRRRSARVAQPAGRRPRPVRIFRAPVRLLIRCFPCPLKRGPSQGSVRSSFSADPLTPGGAQVAQCRACPILKPDLIPMDECRFRNGWCSWRRRSRQATPIVLFRIFQDAYGVSGTSGAPAARANVWSARMRAQQGGDARIALRAGHRSFLTGSRSRARHSSSLINKADRFRDALE